MILDCHTHLPNQPETNPHWIADNAQAIAWLRDCGIDAAICHLWSGVYATEAELIDQTNRDALTLYEESEGFIYPGCCIHPDHPELSAEWLARFREQDFLWVGELVPARDGAGNKRRFDDDGYLALFAECASHGHILQLHNTGHIDAVARTFPGMPVVQSHVGNVEALAACDNTWLDISAAVGGLHVGALEDAYARMGPDRILFGSDFTGYDPRCFCTRVDAAIADTADRQKIYAENLIQLLARVDSRPIL